MKLIVDHSALRTALQLCATCVNKRDERPIMNSLVLRAIGDELRIGATNLTLSAKTSLDAAVRDEGACAVNADALLDIAKNVSGKVTLVLDGGWLSVSTSSAQFKIPTFSADDYPTLPTIDPEDGDTRRIEMSASLILPMIRQCSYAVTDVDQRFNLAGVQFEVVRSVVTSVATDGHRLAMCEASMRNSFEDSVFLPLPLVKASERLTVSPDGFDVALVWNRSHVSIGIGRDEFAALRPDSHFPTWRAMVPQNRKRYLLAPTFELSAAIKSVTPFASKAVQMHVKNNGLTFASTSAARGDASATVERVSYSGEELELSFNGGYLAEAMSHVNTVTTRLAICDAPVPTHDGAIVSFLLIQPEESEAPYTALHMVLPFVN